MLNTLAHLKAKYTWQISNCLDKLPNRSKESILQVRLDIDRLAIRSFDFESGCEGFTAPEESTEFVSYISDESKSEQMKLLHSRTSQFGIA
jgi:hypothetical protein